MGMTPREETKSFRVCSQDENGNEVFAANASYSSRGIFVSYEMINQTYCSAHVSDVQDAISDFTTRLNALLEESNLPIIQVEQ